LVKKQFTRTARLYFPGDGKVYICRIFISQFDDFEIGNFALNERSWIENYGSINHISILE